MLDIIIIIIIRIILGITFLQGIYYYINDTNHVSRVHSFATVLYLQFVLCAMLFRPLNMYYYYPWYLLYAGYPYSYS